MMLPISGKSEGSKRRILYSGFWKRNFKAELFTQIVVVFVVFYCCWQVVNQTVTTFDRLVVGSGCFCGEPLLPAKSNRCTGRQG